MHQGYGPPLGAMVLAVAALMAAALSIWLIAGTKAAPDQRAPTGSSVRGSSNQDVQSKAAVYERVEGPVRSLAPAGDLSGNDIGSSNAFCPSATQVISGGYQAITGDGGVFYSGALARGRVGWAVAAVNGLAQSGTVQAFAYCVSVGRAGSSGTSRRLQRQRAAGRREIQAIVKRYRTLRASQRSGAGEL
jgi:hypothetical protein